MRLDAHQHFWQFDPVRDAWMAADAMAPIRRDFMPADLQPILQSHGFEGCIAVQADQSEAETRFLLQLADQYPFIQGVVGWIDLRSNTLAQQLDYVAQFPRLKGFRHILQQEHPDYMLQPAFEAGLRMIGQRGYTYDILVFPKHLAAVKQLLKKADNQLFVIDHIAKPYIRRGLFRQWAKDMRLLARYEHVYCKISGLVTEANWQLANRTDYRPWLDVVFDAFGTNRLMYGSDWPVCLLAADYTTQLDIVATYTAGMVIQTRQLIFGGNAARFYNIQPTHGFTTR
jgi:L-fuconolactonase